MNWRPEARRLAAEITHAASRWRPVVESIPRHSFVPRWWDWYDDTWILRDGPSDEASWLPVAYSNRSLVTRVGPLHADHAKPGDRPTGRPTSSSTLPGLVVQLARHAYLVDGADVLDVGTGSGYGCAVLTARQGDQHVTSVDVDGYLISVAAARLAAIGQHPEVLQVDATGPLPGSYDRIIATVAVRPIPASWLTGLRPDGRLVTTITGTTLILTADKTPDGGAKGRIEWDRAGFMPTRAGADYPPALSELLKRARTDDGEQVRRGSYPVINVAESWEVQSMLGVLAPGTEHHHTGGDGTRIALLLHPDGSWARATGRDGDKPTVHQAGPRRLWDLLDGIREAWLRDGSLPLHGASVTVAPDGTIHLKRGRWQATIA